MDAIHASMPTIHIRDYPDLEFTHHPDMKTSPTGEVWTINLGGILVFAEKLNYFQDLAEQILVHVEKTRLADAHAVQVDAVAI